MKNYIYIPFSETIVLFLKFSIKGCLTNLSLSMIVIAVAIVLFMLKHSNNNKNLYDFSEKEIENENLYDFEDFDIPVNVESEPGQPRILQD